MKNERSDSPPEWVFNSFDNLEDVLKHITDEGLEELNYKKMEVQILLLGVELTFTNRNNKQFKVIVCHDELSCDDNMRRSLYECGKGIEENFPHIVEEYNELSKIPELLN